MRAVKSKDTGPELLVRHLLHAHGYRYRLHSDKLPGCPDLAFTSRKKVIFVNGCFWHGHNCPRGSRVPRTNRVYWTAKIEGNRRRDAKSRQALENAGWSVLELWECQLHDESLLLRRLQKFLE